MDKRKEAKRQVRKKIEEALLDLMAEKPFSDITITEIVDRAGVARQSYYRNFSSKEEVIEEFYISLRESGMERIREQPSPDPVSWVAAILTVARSRREQLVRLHQAGFSKLYLDVVNQFVVEAVGDMPASSPERYKLYCYSGAMFNSVMVWLQGGCREEPEEVARVMCNFRASDLLGDLVEYVKHYEEA